MYYGKITRPCKAMNQNVEGWFNKGDIVEVTLDSDKGFPYMCVRVYGKTDNYIVPKNCIERLPESEEKLIRNAVGIAEAFDENNKNEDECE